MLECSEESIYAPQFKFKQLNKEITDILISLYKDFREIEDEAAGDFIERNLPTLNTTQDHFIICELFMHFIKHEKFLEKFIQEFYKRTKRIIQTDENILIVLCYLIVLHTSQNHLGHVAQLLIETSQRKVAQLTSFLRYETSVLLLTQCASTYFDQDYIKDYILKEVMEDSEIFKKLHKIICKQHAHIVTDKKKLTVPQHMNVLSHLPKVPRPPYNSRNLSFGRIKPCHIPDTTYIRPITEKKIQEAREENRRNSSALLAEAQLQPAHLTQPAKAKEVELPAVPDIAIIKAKPPPEFKEPELPVKMNYGTVLRQAARIVKEEEKEIKRVKNLTVGALDYTLFEKLYDELKNKEEQEHLQSIEKKHLTGLITYEEAILAKRNLLQTNKEKRVLFEEQRKELEEHLKEWRQSEEEKIKQIIQKTQQIQKLVEEKKRDVLDKKQKLAKEVSEESRTIMAQVLKERTEELNRKIELIKEIRTLNSYRIIRKKEFDDTETMNIGLFCEMSIAELNERLSMLRAEMKEELEMRQKRIKEEKFRQKELLNEMQKLIEFNQIERKRFNAVSEQKRIIEVPESEEIANLRKKLEQTRERRKAGIL